MVEFFNNLASADPGRILLVWVIFTNLALIPAIFIGFFEDALSGFIMLGFSFLSFIWSFFIHYLVYMAVVWLSMQFGVYPESMSAYVVLTILILIRAPKGFTRKSKED